MGFSFIFKTDKKNRGFLTISYFFRALFISMFLVFLATIFFDFSAGNIPLVAIILAFFCIIGFLYRECWVFDPNRQILTYSVGIFPFVKNTTVPFSNIKSIQIVTIQHTKEKIHQMQSKIQTNDGTTLPELETVKQRSATSFTEHTKKIAQILEKQIEYITF